MTSPKYSNKRAYVKDFLRSFAKAWVFPAVALIVLFSASTFPVISYVTTKEFKTTYIHNEISLFIDGFFSMSETLLPMGMVLCGIMTAIFLFSYSMSKKKVNVFFSAPISRTRMFVNRFAAGALALFLSVLLPITATYIVNIVSFGMSAHLTSVYLYFTAVLFTSGLAGLSIGTLASTISGNIFEAGLVSAAVSFIPAFIYNCITGLMYGLLFGYTSEGTSGFRREVLSPFTFAIDYKAVQPEHWSSMDSTSTYYNPLYVITRLLENTGEKGWKIPEDLSIDFGFILPVLIWFTAAVVLIVPAVYLFNRRRAENANSFGKFRLATGIISAFAFFGTSVLAFDIADTIYKDDTSVFSGNAFIFLLISVPATALVYFLVQLIMKRKIKAVGKSFAWYGVMTLLSVIAFTVTATQCFGTYNKLPDVEDIKSASFDYISGPGFATANMKNSDIIVSESQEDIKLVTSVFEKLSKDKNSNNKTGTTITSIRMRVNLKNGKSIVRSFPITSEEVYSDYLRTVYNSSYYDSVLKKVFIDSLENNKSDDEMFQYGDYTYSDTVNFDDIQYVSSSLLMYDKNDELQGCVQIDNVKELYKALYEDLARLDYDTVYKNAAKPVGVISFYRLPADSAQRVYRYQDGYRIYFEDQSSQSVYLTGSLSGSVVLYPEMTSTLKFLNDNGYEIENEYEGKIKEILYTDGKRDLYTVAHEAMDEKYSQYNTWGDKQYFATVSRGVIMDCVKGLLPDGEYTYYDLVKKIFAAGGHPLTSVTDSEQMAKIFDACSPQYDIIGDTGRYVYVVYEDGTMVNYYLPEVSLGVLK